MVRLQAQGVRERRDRVVVALQLEADGAEVGPCAVALRIEADRSREHSEGSIELSQLLQRAAKIEEQAHVVRPEPHQAVEDSHGCLVLSLSQCGIGRRGQHRRVEVAGRPVGWEGHVRLHLCPVPIAGRR